MTQDVHGAGLHYWFPIVNVFVLSIFVLWVPGLIALIRFRMNWIARIALAPLLTLTFQSILITVLPIFHIPWSWVVPFIAGALCVAITVLFKKRYSLLSDDTDFRMSRQQFYLVLFSMVVSCAVGAKVTMGGIGNPEWSNQKWDSAFHLSASEAALQTGNLSPFHLNNFIYGNISSYYPSLFHANVVSLAQISHRDIIVSFNVLSVVISAILWVFACLFLAYIIWGNRPLPLILTALFSVNFTAFPYRYFSFGGLFPNLLSVAVLPFFLAAILLFVEKSPVKTTKLNALALLFMSTIVMLLAQPNTIFFGYFMGIAIVMSAAMQALKKQRNLALLYVALAVAATGIQLYVMQVTSKKSMWPPTKTIAQATLDWVTNSTRWANENQTIVQYHMPLILAILSVFGCYFAAKQQQYRWLLYGYFFLGAIFVIGLGVPDGSFRKFMTGFYYSDQYRPIGAQVVLSIPLAVLGAVGLSQVMQKLSIASSIKGISEQGVLLLSSLAIVGCVLVLYYDGPRVAISQIQENAYAPNSSQGILDDSKLKLMDDIEKIVPENEKIIAVPFTGATSIYPHTGRQLIYPAMGETLDQSKKILASSFKEISTNKNVCKISQDLGVKYAVDYGNAEIDTNPRPEFDGLRNLEGTAGLQKVAQEGYVKLYKVLPCAAS
ncbi:MAG: hypothetical protein QM632_00550 [Micrococcaceae bacterium]